MSVRRIAELAGVSVATVSRVLNNNDKVKKESRERILAVIDELHYQPNLLAKQLRSAKTFIILVIVPDIAFYFHAEIIKSISFHADKHGYTILLCNSLSDRERLLAGIKLLKGCVVDALISLDSLTTHPDIKAYIGNKPWLQCCEYSRGQDFFVGINVEKALRQVVHHFTTHNRRKIALIYSTSSASVDGNLKQNFVHAVAATSLTYCRAERAGGPGVMDGFRAMMALLDTDPPDAIIAESEAYAVGAIRALHSLGEDISHKVDVLVFNGTPTCDILTPSVSMIQQPTEEIGDYAVRMIVKKMGNPAMPARTKFLDYKLALHDSTTPGANNG